MSVKISGKVWDMKLSPGEKLVLLALADHADHNGKNAYPGTDLLAWKTELSTRQVRRILDELEARAVIKKTNGGVGRGQKTCYEFNLEKMTPRPPFQSEKDDTMSTYSKPQKVTSCPLNEKQKGDICDTEKGTFATLKGDIPRARAEERARMNRPEPSLESSSSGETVPHAKEIFDDVDGKKSEQKNGNGNGKAHRFMMEVYREYVDEVLAKQTDVKNPGGLATHLYQTGKNDRDIQIWLDNGKKPPDKKPKENISLIDPDIRKAMDKRRAVQAQARPTK
jgi:hypothetical protein